MITIVIILLLMILITMAIIMVPLMNTKLMTMVNNTRPKLVPFTKEQTEQTMLTNNKQGKLNDPTSLTERHNPSSPKQTV